MAVLRSVRQSEGKRLTLVLYGGAEPIRSLWACMTVDSLKDSVKRLAEREGIKRNIESWSSRDGDKDPPNINGLGSWASQRGIDHVIWTVLGPKFNGYVGIRGRRCCFR